MLFHPELSDQIRTVPNSQIVAAMACGAVCESNSPANMTMLRNEHLNTVPPFHDPNVMKLYDVLTPNHRAGGGTCVKVS